MRKPILAILLIMFLCPAICLAVDPDCLSSYPPTPGACSGGSIHCKDMCTGGTGQRKCTAPNLSKAAVQAAVSCVQAMNGGTVVLPAGDTGNSDQVGNCAWTGEPIEIGKLNVVAGVEPSGDLTIFGAGPEVGGTTIRLGDGANMPHGVFTSGYVGNWKLYAARDLRISRIGFCSVYGRTRGNGSQGFISFLRQRSGTLDHNYFMMVGGPNVVFKSTLWGLVYLNKFIQYTLNGSVDSSYRSDMGILYTPREPFRFVTEQSGGSVPGYRYDLEIHPTDPTKVRSLGMSNKFNDYDDPGNFFRITAGTGFNPGAYKVITADKNKWATLDRPAGVPGSTAGTFTMGSPSCNQSIIMYSSENDVGALAIDRYNTVASGNTVIPKTRTVTSTTRSAAARIIRDDTGTVQRVYVFISSASTNPTVTIATFQNTSGNTFTARAKTNPLPVQVGLNIFTAGTDFQALPIQVGDYIGAYLSGCEIARGGAKFEAGGTTNEYWSLSGDQTTSTNQDWGAYKTNGGISLYAELFDDGTGLEAIYPGGLYKHCEDEFTNWYLSGAPGRAAGYGSRPFDLNYVPGGPNAVFWEDNYISGYYGMSNTDWRSITPLVFRHNTCVFPPPGLNQGNQTFGGLKPGNIFLQMTNNVFVFNKTGNSGRISAWRSSGVFKGNTLINITGKPFDLETLRGSQSYGKYYPPVARPKRFYIYNNRFCGLGSDWSLTGNCLPPTGLSCQGDFYDPKCISNITASGDVGNTFVGINKTYFFRPPKEGEVLYGWKEYPYPHPLRDDSGPAPKKVKGK